jgi:hypothetical protein
VSCYRNSNQLKMLYGYLSEHTVNPRAVDGDQSSVYAVQKEAITRGARYLLIIWFDGLDWQTTQAAALVKSGKTYLRRKGTWAGLSGLRRAEYCTVWFRPHQPDTRPEFGRHKHPDDYNPS